MNTYNFTNTVVLQWLWIKTMCKCFLFPMIFYLNIIIGTQLFKKKKNENGRQLHKIAKQVKN